MSAPLLDSEYVTVYAPFSRPLSFTLLELVVVGCSALTFIDARRCSRKGDTAAMFTWASIFSYGIFIELMSYNVFKSFTHGQFPIMFYHQKLPLYISVIYPVFIYTAVRSVQRFGLSRWAEPFAIGLTIVAIDFPFDILGPGAGWWSWSETDPNMAYRWLGVPVVSYYWHLAWGGFITFMCRGLALRFRDLSGWKLLLAIPVGALTIVGGIILFIPFHIIKGFGVPDGAIVLALFAASLVIFVMARKNLRSEPTPLPLAAALIFAGFHVLAGIAFLARGELTQAPEKLTCVVAAAGFTVAVQLLSRRGLRTSAVASPAT
jgi:hypothetical protein